MNGPVPAEARVAFASGDDRGSLAVLRRARDEHPVGSADWAYLERLVGLVLIHMLREVEGTFALERADAILDASGTGRPGLEVLED